MRQKVFVTGSSGFIGGNLVRALSKKGDSLLLLIRKNGNIDLLRYLNADFVMGSVNDVSSYSHLLKEVDVVYHLAGVVTDWAFKKEYYEVNTEGTKLLLNKAIEAGVKKFIYISTIDVLKRSRYSHNVIDEFTAYTDTKLPYHRSKMLAEKYVLENNGVNGIETVVIRPAWVYGPADKTLFPEIIRQLNTSKVVFLVGKKDTQIPLIYIDNLIDILLKVKDYRSLGGDTFLASDNEDITWLRLVEKVMKAMGKKNKIIFLPSLVGHIFGVFSDILFRALNRNTRPTITSISVEMLSSSIKVDNRKLVEKLGYKQAIPFADGFIRTMRYFTKV